MKNPVLETIYRRRSIRKYKPEQITEAELHLVLEAGRYAPSGGNNQTSHFIVIQNSSILAELKRLAEHEFAQMEVTETMYGSLAHSILQSKKGNYDFTFDAPTLVIAANQRSYGNALADCAVALENMMLAAVSLNIGSCWVNQLKWLTDNPAILQFMKKLGLADSEIICGGLTLGYPDQGELQPLARKGNTVTLVK